MDPRRAALVVLLLASCASPGPETPALPELGPGGDCVDDAEFFERRVHRQVLEPVCATCHTRAGLARESGFVLESAARPDQVAVNRERLLALARLTIDGESLVVVKPTGGAEHGGGEVLTPDGPELDLLREFVARIDAPVADCPGEDDPFGDGLALLSYAETLRKASLLLVGRLPTADETAEVEAGGRPALAAVLRRLTDEPAFVARAQEWFNDRLLTDRYLDGNDALDLLDEDVFPGRYWFEDYDLDDDYGDRANEAVAREPMELLGHILREDLPYTQILTADYTVANAYSALSYGLPGAGIPALDDEASLAFAPVTVPGVPHAGVLTMPVTLHRYPSTATNRNRHRTWAFMRTFLATDLLLFAERPVDSSLSTMHNPTLNDPQCTVCHAVMDPIAGTFQNWGDDGRRDVPVEGWHPDLDVPGFGGTAMPAASRERALAWMAEQAVADDRFAIGAVHFVFRALTGLEPIHAVAVGDDPVLEEAYAAQQSWVLAQAEAFRAGGHDLEALVVQTALSRYFRAIDDAGAGVGDLEQAGTAKWLTPEELDRKIRATLWVSWAESDGTPYLLDRYRMLYGGIDSDAVVERLADPNGLMSNVALRMASSMACRAVPLDLALPPAQRRLLPWVEASFVPETPDGFGIPEGEESIRANIVHLHARLLGEHLSPDDAEIDHTFALWRDTWRDGVDGILAGTVSEALPSECRTTRHAGVDLPDALILDEDPDHTVRAWMAVVAYLLADHRFLVE